MSNCCPLVISKEHIYCSNICALYYIAKKLIPEEYKVKYSATNLFWVELPNFWRMLYTLTDGESGVEIIAFVLDVIDHDAYNKKFGYKKK